MKMYVGNATRQVATFAYRMIESMQLRQQTIQPLSQVQLAGDLTRPEIDYIVEQHARFGMVEESAIDRSGGFNGMCFSIDKPISAVRLSYLFKANIEELVQQGAETRRINAIAQARILETSLIENGRSEIVTGLDVTVQQETQDLANDVAQFSEGIVVNPRGQGPARSGRTRQAA